MRQGQQNRRGRGRGRKPQNPLARSYESNGPDVKIRGTAAHIAEKYMSLARDALSSGDSVGAESYLQHAEHYNRIIMAAQGAQNQPGGQANQPNEGANGSAYRGKPVEDETASDADPNGGDPEDAQRSEKTQRNSKRGGEASRGDGGQDDRDEQSSGAKSKEEGASEEAVN